MYLKEQSYVCALAQSGNMTKAAELLFISQPALSTYIKALEDRLGEPLFIRKAGMYTPTYLGEMYLQKARKMLALQDTFNTELGLIRSGIKGRLRIGIQTRRSSIIMGPIMQLINQEYPNIELIVEEGNYNGLRRLLLSNRIDLMICSALHQEPILHTKLISKEVLLFAVHHHSPLIEKAIVQKNSDYLFIDLHEAAKECFFLPHSDQSLRSTCDEIFLHCGFVPKKQMLIRSIETSLRLVSEGHGVAFNRSGYLKVLSHIPNLFYMRLLQDEKETDFSIFYQSENNQSPSFLQLVERLAKILLDSNAV